MHARRTRTLGRVVTAALATAVLAPRAHGLAGGTTGIARAQDSKTGSEATPTPDGKDSGSLQRMKERAVALSRELEATRGEKLARPVDVLPSTTDEYRALYQAELSETLTPERSQRVSRAFARIGLLPVGYDLHARDVETSIRSAAVVFDRRSGSLLLLKPDATDHRLDYEGFAALAYAQEYQRTDMKKFFGEGDPDRDDVLLARRFLSEGEVNFLETMRSARTEGSEASVPDRLDDLAALTRSEFADLQRHTDGMAPADAKSFLEAVAHTAKLPAFAYHTLIDTSMKGAALVGKLYRTGGWAAVDELWKHPPNSTAQVLHWKKLAGPREEPIRFEVPDLSARVGAGVHRTIEYTLGELGIRSFLEELKVGEKDALKLAKGWRGDRLAAFEKDGAAADSSETTCAWVISWESPEGAKKLLQALQPALEKAVPGKCTLGQSGSEIFVVVSAVESRDSLLKSLQSETKKLGK